MVSLCVLPYWPTAIFIKLHHRIYPCITYILFLLWCIYNVCFIYTLYITLSVILLLILHCKLHACIMYYINLYTTDWLQIITTASNSVLHLMLTLQLFLQQRNFCKLTLYSLLTCLIGWLCN